MANEAGFNVNDFVEVTEGFYKGLKGYLHHYDDEHDVYMMAVNEDSRVNLKGGCFVKIDAPIYPTEPKKEIPTINLDEPEVLDGEIASKE